MKFCSKCGEKLVDNHCPKCKGNTSKRFFNKKSVLVSLFGIIIICCSFWFYKNHVESEFIDNYNTLYSDSTKSVPNMDLDEQKVKKMEKSLWAVSGDKLEYKKQLADVREKVNVRDKVNQLFDEPIPDNFDSTYLTINSDTRIETPEIEGDDTFSKGLRSVVNYYNRQFDMLESVQETINSWNISLIDLTDIDTLENSIQSINDTKINDKANELAKDIVTIKTDFEDYFNGHVGWHFNLSDNQLGDIYHFNFPENELSWGAFQGSGMTGYINAVKYDMKNKVYYVVTPLISMDKTVYDTTITPITLIDKDTISINNQIAMYDPEQVEAYNVFQNKPSAKVDAMKKAAFDSSAMEIASKDDATIYFSKFKDSIGLPEKVSYEFITEEKEMYEFNIRINSEGSEEVTNRAGTAIVYQNGYMTYKKAD